jgi:hypothetical protein
LRRRPAQIRQHDRIAISTHRDTSAFCGVSKTPYDWLHYTRAKTT